MGPCFKSPEAVAPSGQPLTRVILYNNRKMLVHKHFHFLTAQRVLVCKQCRYATWPDEIPKHLAGKAHTVKRDEIDTIRQELREYQGLATIELFEFPPKTNSAIRELLPAKQGMACKECSYVCSTSERMRLHHRSHGWTPSGRAKRGRLTKMEQRAADAERQKRVRRVAYQQFFRSRRHSAYFEVAAPLPSDRSTTSDMDKMRKIATREVKAGETIREGSKFEVNPWLDLTGWARYLKDKDRGALLALIKEPEEEETVAKKVWDTVAEVASISQQIVVDSSNTVRYAAIGTDKDKKQAPLKPYFNHSSIAGRARTWQEIVVCLVRNHDDRTIDYKMTKDQDRKLRRLLEAMHGSEDEDGDKMTACLDRKSVV